MTALAVASLTWPLVSCDNSTDPGDRGTVRTRWFVAQPGYSPSRPAVSGDAVFVGTGDGHVIARNTSTGTARWSTQISGGQVDGSDMLVRGGVVVAVATYETVGLDAATGQQLWRYSAPPDPGGISPSIGGLVQGTRLAVDDATVYVPAWGASVSAVDLHTGQARWTWRPGATATDTAAAGRFRSGAEGVRLSGDTVFAGVWHNVDRLGFRSESWIVALDRVTGAELWRVVLPAYTGGVSVDGAPALSGNLVLLGTLGGHVWAVDRTSRQVAWHFASTPHLATISQPEAAGGVVYRDGGDGQLYALRAADGTVAWKAPAGQLYEDMLVTDRKVYASNTAQLFVYDRQSGKRLAALDQPHPPAIGGGLMGSPAVLGAQVFVVMSGGVWSFDEP